MTFVPPRSKTAPSTVPIKFWRQILETDFGESEFHRRKIRRRGLGASEIDLEGEIEGEIEGDSKGDFRGQRYSSTVHLYSASAHLYSSAQLMTVSLFLPRHGNQNKSHPTTHSAPEQPSDYIYRYIIYIICFLLLSYSSEHDYYS